MLHPGDFGLGKVPARLRPDATTRSICGFCSTGCSLDAHLQSGVAVNLTPTADYPVNLGMACPKGWEALTPLAASDRGTTPLLRDAKSGKLEPTDWDQAMQVFTLKFKALMDQHGPESVAVLSTGQICTEEMAFLGALFKFGMGGVHCDSNTRQCMATSHVAYKQSFGFDAPPYTYADFEESDVLVFIGSNLCIAHPILWQRVLRNKKNPEIIVIDPRRTETAMNATQHLALQPKSDLTLLYGVANLLIQNKWLNREFIERSTTGFAEFAGFVRQFTPDKVAAETGLTVGQLYHFAETIHHGKAVSFWWTMGVNQSHEATRTAQAIINLALMTGNIGRPGTGANSITGQCNAMGSRLFANATSLLGGRDFLNAGHRAEVARLLPIPVEKIPDRNSLAYDQIIHGIANGKIKGLWVIATNPSHSWIARGSPVPLTPALSPSEGEKENRPQSRRKPVTADGATSGEITAGGQSLSPLPFRRGEGQGEGKGFTPGFDAVLDQLEFLVVQDMYPTTETAQRAHLFLPAAGWGEKEGTFINSERRFGHIKKISRAPGQAMSDFNIFRLVASYWGCASMFSEWSSPQAAFQILKRLSAGQPCDITGIEDYRHLDAAGGIQWPLPLTPALSPSEGERENRGQPSGEAATVGGRVCMEISGDMRMRSPLPLGGGEGKGEGVTREAAVEPVFARERRLFADGKFFHADGKARFLFDPPRPVAEPADNEFPFVLLTGRGTSAQWHTNTRTGKSAVLRTLYPAKPYIEIHPTDAARLRLDSNTSVAVVSRRARVECTAVVTPTVQPGQVFLPMHYNVTNQLTRAEFDPHSRQPSYKFCAVRLEKIV